jgi:hypothetical protein
MEHDLFTLSAQFLTKEKRTNLGRTFHSLLFSFFLRPDDLFNLFIMLLANLGFCSLGYAGGYLAFMLASTNFGEDVVTGRNNLSVLIVNFVHVEAIVKSRIIVGLSSHGPSS